MYRTIHQYYVQLTKTRRTYFGTKFSTLKRLRSIKGETTSTALSPDEMILPIGVL